MYLSESSMKKWSPVLDHPDLPKIEETYRKQVTAVLLENQEKALQEEKAMLTEAAPANNSGGVGVDRYDPILIGLVRRAMPNLIAYDIAGVQPMTGPTGLIFAMKSLYGNNRTDAGATEALFNEANTGFSSGSFNKAGNLMTSGTGQVGDNPVDAGYNVAQGATTSFGEALGDADDNSFGQMSFSIDKTTVTARTRALKAEYTLELAQDLKAVHGLDAETELSNILSQEIMFEINREVVRRIYLVAKAGSTDTAVPGTFNLDVDSNGRWSVERFKGLLFNIERDCNHIGQDTRRGKGNFVLCSSDVASALSLIHI